MELQCETDFVARTDDFGTRAQACNAYSGDESNYLDDAGIPLKDIEHERELASEALKAEGKPAEMIEKIVDGKLKNGRRVCSIATAVRDG